MIMDEPPSLRTLFASVLDLRKKLESSLTPTSSAFQETLRNAIINLDECRKLADGIGLFSSNETQDDISSADLQYEPWPSEKGTNPRNG